MKRFLCILIMLLLLSGCSKNTLNTTVPQTTVPLTTAPVTTAPETTVADTQPTEPDLPWIEEAGQPWDEEGSLLELSVTVPNGLIYSSFLVFHGDLLLWTEDDHRLDQPRTQLCLIDLDSGQIQAQTEIPIVSSTLPQVLGDRLYLFDCNSGLILELDQQLQEVRRWQTDIREAELYMSADGTAYVQTWESGAYAMDLETGRKRPILAEEPEIYYLMRQDSYLHVEYYHPDTGERCVAFIDLHTGQHHDLPLRDITGCYFRDGNWLAYEMEDAFVYTLIPAEGEPLRAEAGYSGIRLLDNDLLLMINEDNNRLSLHDLTGRCLAECVLTERDYGYLSFDVIPSENFGGYFVVLSNNDRGIRLLHWDPAKNQPGQDIPFAPIPEPTQQEALVQSRVEELKIEYGLNILVGTETETYFFDFEVEQVTDWQEVLSALDTLEEALNDYPKGFFRQLRYGDAKRLEINLMGTITAIDSEYTDTYVAFVQEAYDGHVMVVDIFQDDLNTYYHEFSHIVDSYLEWDAMQRENALFSDEIWCSLNPSWFPGYSYSYSWEQYVQDYSSFIDSYSTINPTEDRARVLEHAMVSYGAPFFEVGTVLTEKLDYYCRCIRDAFDTTGWPDTVLWEQYLP